MRISALGFLAALVILQPAAVSADDWDRLDSIVVSHVDQTKDVGILFDGRLDRVAFRARERAVHCDIIRINFVNGGDQVIRNRRFPLDARVAFDLQGNDRHVTHIHFNCEPVGAGRGPARLVIFGR